MALDGDGERKHGGIPEGVRHLHGDGVCSLGGVIECGGGHLNCDRKVAVDYVVGGEPVLQGNGCAGFVNQRL